MNEREAKIKKKYEEQGWKMLRGGAPDYIALKVNSDGKILTFQGVEVKSKGSLLTYEQQIYKKIFEMANIPYIVEVEE